MSVLNRNSTLSFQRAKMSVIAYSRISTDQQDLEKQKHLLLQYAQKQGWLINEFIEVSISSRKNTKQRKIDELLEKLQPGDVLLVAELSRLGRNMLETLNIINTLSQTGIKIVFVRQPELSTTATHAKLLLAIYSYFAESERDYISIRTKQGLAVAKAMGKQLGRPKGSKNKKGRVLDSHKPAIKKYLELGVTISDITKIINDLLETPITYNAFKYFIKHDEDLAFYMKKSNT
ncbi:MAG: recombinase family protein [Bacteroidetes bacterium]|jgi:DNA invertase Pin-like site-specific DNA recombinase|nr:recombinase family protein [Bacteroidota bacterium]